MRRAYLILTAVTALLYLALAWFVITRLMPGAGGLMPFDGRFLGYTAAEASVYQGALGDAARAAYLGPVRWLDTVFPVALAGWLAFGTWLLTPTLFQWSRLVLTVPAWGYCVMDLCENALVAEVLRAAPDVPLRSVQLASRFTATKYQLLLAAALVLLGVLVWRAMSTRRGG